MTGLERCRPLSVAKFETCVLTLMMFVQIVPTENDDGRLGVRLYTQLQDGRQVAVTSLGQGTEEVAVKSEHLLRHDQNCTEFLAYLGAKAVGHMQRRELDVALPIMRRYLQRQPGQSPMDLSVSPYPCKVLMQGPVVPGDIGMWATLANVLRETGQMSQSIEILRNILDNPLPPSMAPNKHKFQYDLSAALEKSGDLAGAFEVCTAIQTGSQVLSESIYECVRRCTAVTLRMVVPGSTSCKRSG